MTRTTTLLGATLATLAASAAAADTFLFTADLSGLNEVPANNSPATGTLTATFDNVAESLTFSWNITGLVGNPATPGSHIHNAPAGSNGPIVFGFNQPNGTWPASGSATWNNVPMNLWGELFAGNLYANFHTDQFASGEVRGQLILVPAPASLALLAAAPLAIRRRR